MYVGIKGVYYWDGNISVLSCKGMCTLGTTYAGVFVMMILKMASKKKQVR